MKFLVVASLALYFCSMTGAQEHAADEENHIQGTTFCYRDEDGCGPSTSAWDPVCHSGERQSPITLPDNLRASGLSHLRMIGAYRGNFFRMQNSGHSVSIDFVGNSGENEGPAGRLFAFPDPLAINRPGYTRQEVRQYKFASAHFHWGVNDSTTGSEHCIGTKCSAMELHLVHYLANYTSMKDALASGDESALTVLGLFINTNALSSLFGGLINRGHPSLAPIVKNLNKVPHASHEGGFATINEPLDLTKLIVTEDPAQVYSYKGSLTTPGCNEQVNWFVLKRPAVVPHSDLEAFRTKLMDFNGETLNENHRPTQNLNGRKVLLTTVLPTL